MYSNLEKNAEIVKKLEPVFNINFINGPYVDIRNVPGSAYDVSFIDDETGFVHYRTKTFNNCWAKSNISYFVKWRMKMVDEDGRVFEYLYDAREKKVFIALESRSIGDTLAWFPYIDEFRKKWGCKVVCSTFWNYLFQSEYPELEFVSPGSVVAGIYAMYKIGWFYDEDGNVNAQLNPSDFKKLSLQQTASDILGIDFSHIRARICAVEQAKLACKDRVWLEQTYEDIFKAEEYRSGEVDICKNDIVVDLGGNYGMFTLYALHKGAKKVYTFEPFEEYVGYIRENTKNFANVEIMPFAMSNADGAAKMNINHEDNTILQEVYERNNWSAGSQTDIETMRFGTFLERHNLEFVNFLKVDIEGSEYALFEDIEDDVLKNKIGKISMEYHWDINGRLSSIVEKLERCGFEVSKEPTNDQVGKIYAINRGFSKRPKKRVGIAMHSTAQTKYWNNPTGWQEVTDFLLANGYEVILLSRESDGYMGNFQPAGIIKHPDGSFESLINVMKSCELFIGIGSGLSWLAWSLNVPTVLISGFSTPVSEFEGEGVLRIFNESVCNGCYNRYRFNAGDWNWCPDHKGTERQFECTKSITGSMVIDRLKSSGFVKEAGSLEKETVLILSTGRRIEYFKKTIECLFEKNADLRFKKVWILDDRSTPMERGEMEVVSKAYFGDNYNIIGLNSEDSCYFVEKFNLIRALVEPEDVVFLLEDDWECVGDLRLDYHINRLKNSDWTQIAFADSIDIQDESTQTECVLDEDYWKNPYPSTFRHIHKWIGDMSIWNTVYINNWTNNPSVIKGEVFHRAKFNRVKNFEFDFAQRMCGNQVFTQKIMFRHFGENSLISEIK